MKKIIISASLLLVLSLCICSCKKAETESTSSGDKDGIKPITDVQKPMGTPGIDLDAYLEQAAGASGNKLNDKIKEKEEAEKKGDKSKSDSAEESDKKDKDKVVEEIGSNEKFTGTSDELRELMKGGYAKALTDEELTRTVKLALTYINKKHSVSLNASDLKAVGEKSDLYDNYPLYNKGNIIIYTFDLDGKAQNVVVARANTTSSWKVLDKGK